MDKQAKSPVTSDTRTYVVGAHKPTCKKSSNKIFMKQVTHKIFSHLNSPSLSNSSLNYKFSTSTSSKSSDERRRSSSSSLKKTKSSSSMKQESRRSSASYDSLNPSTPHSRETSRIHVKNDEFNDDSYCTPSKQICKEMDRKLNTCDTKSNSFTTSSASTPPNDYIRKELRQHRQFVAKCTENSRGFVRKSFSETRRQNSDSENSFVSPSSMKTFSDMPPLTPDKSAFPDRGHRLSERYTSSTTGPAANITPFRKRRSNAGDMDYSPTIGRPALFGKSFYEAEMKSTYFMNQLNENQLESARNILENELNSNIPYVDTHCHLDFLFKRMSFYDSVDEYFEKTFFKLPKNFEGCITDWCQPSLYPRAIPVLKASSQKFKLWGAIGCHPHFVSDYNDATEKRIEFHISQFENIVAWGEMGLDYSDRFGKTDHNLQKSVFIRQLKQATRRNLPLVIHCRDADPDLVEIMMKYVPHDTKIHRHCLTTEEKDVRELLDYFPNCYVGFTNLLTNRSACKPRDAVEKIPLERIVLETDSPYFIPRSVTAATRGNAKWSHPGMASCVAAEVSYIKDLPVEDVLETIRDNVFRLYGI